MADMEAAILGSIASLAARQYGLISLHQLADLGVSRSQIRTLLARGVLVTEAPRVLAVAGAPAAHRRSLLAGLLCLGPSAMVSHEAAATIHSFDRCIPGAIEFSMPRTGRGRVSGFVVHTSGSFGPTDRVTVDGLRCTSATRTILDLARSGIAEVRLEAAIDSAVRSGASAPSVIARRLDELRGPGRWGAPLLDRLLVDAGGHTMLERRFLALLRAAGLPRPRTQVVHRKGTRTVARVDFLWDELGVVAEVSGRRGHVSDAERARDAQRRNELQDMDHRVFEYTWGDVKERPDQVIATLRHR